MNKNLLNKFCLSSGLIAVVCYFIHDFIGATFYPGYNWLSQAVSDLTAVNAPSFIFSSTFSSLYGLLACLCCISICLLIKNKNKIFKIGIYLFLAMNLISFVGYLLFPLSNPNDFQTFVHVYVITVFVVILSIISLILISIGSFKDNKKILGVIAILTLLCMFIGAMGSNFVSIEYFGLVERFSTYSAVVFVGVLSLFGFYLDD